MQFKNALDLVNTIYNIDCTSCNCQKCKEKYGELKWCPKAYADDIITAVSTYTSTIPKIKSIVKIINEHDEEV